jgi:enoyl-CoA hydratase/carnithine racemase
MSAATTHRYDTSRYRAPAGLTEHSPALLRFTIANPPINLFDPDVYAGLRLPVDRMQADPELRVVIFDSADPGYFISRLDVARPSGVPDRPGAATLSGTWHDTVTRLARAPVLSIASIRGRSRGIGNEFALACDLRFASRERALTGQPEIGFGLVPGGGAVDWRPGLAGRSRALEILASGSDFDLAQGYQPAMIVLAALCAAAALVTALFVSDDRRAVPRLAPPPRCHGCAAPVPGPVPDRAETTRSSSRRNRS